MKIHRFIILGLLIAEAFGQYNYRTVLRQRDAALQAVKVLVNPAPAVAPRRPPAPPALQLTSIK